MSRLRNARFSRREFLALSATATTATLLAACNPAPTAAPTQAAVATQPPAATLPPEATVAPTEAAVATQAPVATTAGPAAAGFEGTGGLTLPISAEPLTVRGFSTALYAPAPGVRDLNDQLFFQEAAKRTNISFTWQMAAADATNPVDLVMATGDLPDWFHGITPSEAVDYGQQGAIAPLNDLIEQYCPNFKAILEQYPEIKGQLTAPDGTIYFFPRLLLAPETRNFTGFIIRQDWLDEVGMEIPTTTDELYEVLKAFKAQDANRYPLTFDPRTLIWAFGVGGRGAANAIDFYRDGETIKFAPTEPAFADGLAYINKLYSEGLIDPDWPTIVLNNDAETLKEHWLTGISGVQFGYAGSHLSSLAAAMKEAVPEAVLVPMLPPNGPSGLRENLSVHNLIDAGTAGAISASSQHQAEIAQFIDYLYSPEGQLLFFWGLPGDTFNVDGDGVPQYTDKVLNNDLSFSVGEYVWNYISPDWFGPMVYPAVAYLQSVTPEAQAGLQLWSTLETKQKLPVLNFTPDENDVVRTTMPDITTLLDESVAQFIDGSKSLDEFPAMVDQINSIGIADVTSTYQTAYDRFLAA